MAKLGEYVLTLTAAALACSMLLSLLKEGTTKSFVRLFCGVFLTMTAFSPLTEISLPSVDSVFREYRRTGEVTAAAGENLAKELRRNIITERVEAYILDKAVCLGLDLQAEVTLGPDDLPRKVRLRPEPDRENRQQLDQIIVSDLGIPKENLQWSG